MRDMLVIAEKEFGVSLIQCTTLFGHTKLVPQTALVFRPTVYELILHNHQVLLITTRSTGKYYFPGGGIECGERIIEALKREVREETGLEIDVTHLLHVEEHFFYHDPTEEAWHSLLFFYRCTPRSLDVVHPGNDTEVASVEWRDIATLQPAMFQRAARTVVQHLKALYATPQQLTLMRDRTRRST